jgi:hypothetical protein
MPTSYFLAILMLSSLITRLDASLVMLGDNVLAVSLGCWFAAQAVRSKVAAVIIEHP